MMRRGVWLWLCVALAVGFGVYQLKLKVQGLEQRYAKVNREVLEAEETIHVLKAEWSYLNQPERIDELARKYLGLSPLAGKQFGSLDDIPQHVDAAEPPPLPLPVARPKMPKSTRVTLVRDMP